MGVFGDVRAFFNATGSVFMILALAAADHLWGDHVFNCPCGNQLVRRLYTSAFFVVPPVLIIIIDISWRMLCGSLRQNCCCCECGNECKGSCCCSCKCGQCCNETCCDRNCRACETVCRLIARPIIIAIVWVIFSCMEPKFGTCIFKTSTCDSESERRASKLRFVMAVVMSSLTLLLVVGVMVIICRSCSLSPMELEDSRSQKALTRILYAMGLVPKTVLRLRHEGLMDEKLLLHLSNHAINSLGSSITIGQLEILRVHKTDIRLVEWLLDNGFSESDVRKVLVEAQKFTHIEAVRNSPKETNRAAKDAANKLLDELREHGIVPAP